MKSGLQKKLKKEIGRRFKLFRDALGKTQYQLGEELDVYQSTLTNVELGRTFPRIHYILYFNKKYNLNIYRLLTGTGEMFNKKETVDSFLIDTCKIRESDPDYENIKELVSLMRVPLIKSVIFDKLNELKLLAKDEIQDFFSELRDS